jgi:hypothetical protein
MKCVNVLIASLLLITSCSSFKTKKEISEESADKTSQEKNGEILIDSSEPEIHSDSDGEEEDHDPSDVSEQIEGSRDNEARDLSIVLADGGIESVSYIGFLKGLELKKSHIEEIDGRGMGLLIAALYAKHQKANILEWKLFKILNPLLPIRSEAMLKDTKGAILDFVKSEFLGLDFDDLPMLKVPKKSQSLLSFLTEQVEEGWKRYFDKSYIQRVDYCHLGFNDTMKRFCVFSGKFNSAYEETHRNYISFYSIPFKAGDEKHFSFSDYIAIGTKSSRSIKAD